MARQEGTTIFEREHPNRNIKKKGKRLTYFFVDGDLHKSLHINRSSDVVTCWNYPQAKMVTYSYSLVKRTAGRCFTLPETAKMLNRGHLALERAIKRGDVPTPQFTYGINENKNLYQYMLSEDDVLEFHRYFQTVHMGRPRKDGIITPRSMPNERELRAMMRQQTILYVKTPGGFVPSWEAENF